MVEFRGEKLKYLITLVVFFPVHVQETQIIFTVFSWHLCAGLGSPSEYVQSSAIAGNCNVYSQPLISQDTYDKVKFRPFFWGDSKRWDCTFGALLGLALVLIAAFSQLIILFYWCEFYCRSFHQHEVFSSGFPLHLKTEKRMWHLSVPPLLSIPAVICLFRLLWDWAGRVVLEASQVRFGYSCWSSSFFAL